MMNYEIQNHIHAFFEKVLSLVPVSEVGESIIVTHLLEDRPWFLKALNKIAPIRCVIPKAKSINSHVRDVLQHEFNIEHYQREFFNDPQQTIHTLKQQSRGKPLVLLDIGGYFAEFIACERSLRQLNIAGIIEDTENGQLKYEKIAEQKQNHVSLFSVARSQLKKPENFLVGQSVVFSAESLLRKHEKLLHGLRACVIGYGNIGRSVAQHLHERHVQVTVYDRDPMKMIEAMTHGYPVAMQLSEILPSADIIFSITGNQSLTIDLFRQIKNGAYIASVTSPDDEFALEAITRDYKIKHKDEYISEYINANHHVYMLNRGQAVNFLHGSVVSSFIQLLQAEMLVATALLLNNQYQPGFYEVPEPLQRQVAKLWLEHFSQPNGGV